MNVNRYAEVVDDKVQKFEDEYGSQMAEHNISLCEYITVL